MSIRQAILALVKQRGPDKSVCPSEVARTLYSDDWQSYMPAIREAARQLLRDGHVRVTQGDLDLDAADTWRGPIRLRLAHTGCTEHDSIGVPKPLTS